ncbi:hypothetical protein LPJ77_000538 [Coemansia sp. RSA 2523]|nr:hypothetical protein LPJ54_000470 [Coemansia sp. RSA 1824]KAJ1784822.1 hypothetical protein LPJ62_004483 [Coemansia sp. RSA 2167]KAJ1810915.1 hypothetical protein LPJ77_000538 [Coemansia sp. RSA 2523]KAJ2148877.1 hypothetical protein IW142_000583 [Coemansia sp. RSA 564]KAJ2155645.1 hypothetical protein J3F82_000128 [Coemansia sp. RSA 637]KAJ2170037.1 hypothetical protein GGH15_000129 [Coemansia sp. RSA 562]KAJ2183304.1 hypothetical protein GGF45_000029 [Coemansia sp. RSA 551]KAJ2189337.1 
MSAFHNDIFNRRGSSAFLNEFRQDNRSGVFAPAAMPKPLFSEDSGRRASFGGHEHFAYVEGCEICEEYVRRGADICVHEHRKACRGAHRGCSCHRCIEVHVTVQRSSDNNHTRCATPSDGYRARTEQSETDSAFGNGRVRARSSTTTTGDASFGFANMDSEMLRMAADNRWRSAEQDRFYRPLDSRAAPCPPGHVALRENNVGQMFQAHQQMHGGQQSHMHKEAEGYFGGHNRPMPLFGAYGQYGHEKEEDEVKVTTTTTTSTKTTRREVPCEEKVVCHVPVPPVVEHKHHEHKHNEHHHSEHHHTEHHHHVTVIPVGTRPDVPVKQAEACCTWCRFLPCLSCPHPTNPNARFKKQNFRLYPEYEFLPDHLDVAKPTDYFPNHTQVPSRASFKVTIPKVTDVAQRVYVDFIGDQMVVMGEHGRVHPRHVRSSPSVRSTRSSTIHEAEHAHMRHMVPHAGSRVFAKNFFVPRDTYDRDRAQAFIKPNGKLKIVVPVLGQ